MFLRRLSLISMLLAHLGCQDTPPERPALRCKSASSSSSYALLDAKSQVIEFQKDILPILSSNKDDEVYKCTTCHAGYIRESHFDREKLDAILAQVEGLRMPLNGDEMRKEQIELIRKWRDQKFPLEGPSQGGGANGNGSSKPESDPLRWEDDTWDNSGGKKPNDC